jgi:hypothetical protein
MEPGKDLGDASSREPSATTHTGMQVAAGRGMTALPAFRPDALPGLGATGLRALAMPRPGRVLTLYAPLRPAFPRPRATAAAYRSVIADARAELRQAGVAEAEARDIGNQLAAVETDLRRFERPAAGLAVLHDRSSLRVYALPVVPARGVTIAETFALRPLLAAIRHNRRYFVLAMSANRGKGLHRVDDVAAAAAAGRIRRLWVRPDERMPGAIDPSSGTLVGGRKLEDVLDGLVTLVLRHGGEVLVADRIPSGDSLAAELH